MSVPDWARAHGPPLFTARIREHPADFCVDEICEIEFSGDGEHDYLWIEKTGANTHWAAAQLAAHAGVPVRDVGYAGLKDRHAVTRQWFSVRRVVEVDWQNLSAEGLKVLEQRRHRRKLRRGAHRGNAFRIALRNEDLDGHVPEITDRLAEITRRGVPNYFGEQRFGRGGANIGLCRRVLAGRRTSRHKRSIALSAGRALIFNTLLDNRVREGSWACILPGELANLAGSGSVFAVDTPDAELERRCAEGDIHPSGPLWGEGSPQSSNEAADRDAAAAVAHEDIARGLAAARLETRQRALRLRVESLAWTAERDVLWLGFSLAKGGYATAVLRELASVCESPGGGSHGYVKPDPNDNVS